MWFNGIVRADFDDVCPICDPLRVPVHILFLSAFVAVAGKLAEDHLSVPYNRWFNREKMSLVAAVIVFCVR